MQEPTVERVVDASVLENLSDIECDGGRVGQVHLASFPARSGPSRALQRRPAQQETLAIGTLKTPLKFFEPHPHGNGGYRTNTHDDLW
mgnify:CR=1 FL=1